MSDFPKMISLAVLMLLVGCSLPIPPECEPGSAPEPPRPVRRILCLASEDLRAQGLDHIDAQALTMYREQGFELDFDYYQRVDAARLKQYHAVVGMMPMLHAGTRAISEELGHALSDYISAGGGFALLPAPSYYGVTDYVRQLNPFLASFGLELLNEQPRDPAHQRVLSHIIAYRYLQTTNIMNHPVTEGVDALWLPLDYTDAYILTHTFRADKEWTVLVRGNPSTATYTYKSVAEGRRDPGTYDTAPPLLAVRTWGRGRMALFATSSQYFIFDAYHRAFGNGFVMREGGARLMTQLLAWLTASGYEPVRDEAAPRMSVDEAVSNVPMLPAKADWFRHVLDAARARGYGVERYINCGAMSDAPWTADRREGYLADRSNWSMRWSWTEVFHATASNGRGFKDLPMTYRIDGLDTNGTYQLGVLVWAPRQRLASSIRLRIGDEEEGGLLAVPSLMERQGPAFHVLDVPPGRIAPEGRLELHFQRGTRDGDAVGAVCEVWLFRSGLPDVPVSALESVTPETVVEYERAPVRRFYKGLIGAQSLHSGGTHSVEELAAAARRAGLDYLVFLEHAHRMEPEAWDDFVEECRRASDGAFRAIPGISFEARRTDVAPRPDAPQSHGSVRAYVFQYLQKLPDAADYPYPQRLFWKLFGGELSGGHGAPPTLLTPSLNSISPFYQRFWRGLNLITENEDGEVIDDARDLYAEMVDAGYGPQPRASGVYRTPESIERAARADWLMWIEAPSLEVLESYHYTACLSNGPELLQWQLTFDHSGGVGSGNGVLFVDADWVMLHIRMKHEAGWARVTLYDGLQPLRVWYPEGTDWSVVEPLHVARSRQLWLHAEGKDGRALFTGRISVQENTFQLGMCGDNQNTIGNLAVTPLAYHRDERQLFQPHAYWHTGEVGGQLGVMLNPSLHVPRVIETGIIQPVKHFKPMPRLTFADGATEDHDLAELRILSADHDHNRIEYRFDQPGCRARSQTVLTTFRPSPEGATVVLVESEIEALEEITLKPEGGMEALRIALLPELTPAWHYAFRRERDGQLIENAFPYDEMGSWSLRESLRADSGVWFYPGDIASLLVLPLDGKAYALDLRLLKQGRAREYAGFIDPVQRWARGERRTARFLVVLHTGPERDAGQIDDLVSAYRTRSMRFSEWTNAQPEPSLFLASAEVVQGATTFEVDTEGLLDPLPLRLRGLNPNGDFVVKDGGRTYIRQPSRDGVGQVAFEPGHVGRRVFAGHPIMTDDPHLRLEWGGMEAGTLVFYAHNPSDRPVATRCSVHPLWPEQPSEKEIEVRLGPGESGWYRIR